MQVHSSPQVNEILESAASQSMRRNQYFVGVEHLFVALITRSDLLPQAYATKYLGDLNRVAQQLERASWKGKLPGRAAEVFYTPRAGAALNEGARLAQQLSRSGPTAGHLMLALLADPYGSPSRVMDGMGLKRSEHIATLRAVMLGRADAPPEEDAAPRPAAAQAPQTGGGDEPGRTEKAVLDKITRDLTALANRGKLTPAIGRDNEMITVLEVAGRKTKNNVILVGDAGVGKTQIVEGLALALARGPLKQSFPSYRFIELNMAALTAGTQYRGAFEEKILALLDELKRHPDTVLFIDEIHLIMGAGATDGGGADFANLLKPALARGEIRCIGATTLDEYRKFIARDPALERRFQMVRVEALSEEATYKVLRAMQPSLEKHHGVRIGKRAMKTAISLSERYMPSRNLPDKAIDIVDQTCARMRLRLIAMRSKDPHFAADGPPKITPHDIREVLSRMASVPLEDITAEERSRLGNLERQLGEAIIGQDIAVQKVASAVKKSRAGLTDPNHPDAVMLFLGPTGVGKTQLAKALANQVFGSTQHLLRFDMTEYTEPHSVSRLLGSPPGYVGHDEDGQLATAIQRQPYAVVLFDEIEKAHPKVFDIFLPLLDEGRIKDARGRELDFTNTIILFTSNIGADAIHRGDDPAAHRRELLEALHRHFRPEFINRIDDIVPFHHLLPEDIRKILWLNLREVRKRLKAKGNELYVYQQAYEYLAREGYSEEYGARELRRAVDRLVTTPISEKLVDGSFKPGDIIAVRMENGRLTFTHGDPAHCRTAKAAS